jgi:hypothetical protein
MPEPTANSDRSHSLGHHLGGTFGQTVMTFVPIDQLLEGY